MRPPSVTTVRAVVFGSVVLTLFHFADNAIYLDTYPKASWQPDWFWAVVVAGWFLFTAVGVVGVQRYVQGRYRSAHPLLLLYGYLVITSLGHFAYGSPSELTTRGVVSVFVDVTAGTLVLGVTAWSIVSRARTAAR